MTWNSSYDPSVPFGIGSSGLFILWDLLQRETGHLFCITKYILDQMFKCANPYLQAKIPIFSSLQSRVCACGLSKNNSLKAWSQILQTTVGCWNKNGKLYWSKFSGPGRQCSVQKQKWTGKGGIKSWSLGYKLHWVPTLHFVPGHILTLFNCMLL